MLLHYENVKSFKPKNQLFPAKNDLVLLYEEKQPTQKWLLAKIVDLIPSQDGQIRGARVLLEKSRNTVDRPLKRLYPLETNSKFALKDSEQKKVQEVMKEETCRPKREASELAGLSMRPARSLFCRLARRQIN